MSAVRWCVLRAEIKQTIDNSRRLFLYSAFFFAVLEEEKLPNKKTDGPTKDFRSFHIRIASLAKSTRK
jgi:hypothetical protein